MTSLTNPFSETTGWSYLNNNWPQTRTMSDGAATTETYNARGEVTDQKTTLSGSTLADFAAPTSGGYDGAGNRLAVTVAGSSSPGSTAYAYDGRDELTGESSTRGSGYTNVNHYDGYTSGTTTGSGNPTTLRGTGQSFNADNELTGTGYAYEGDGSPKTYKGSGLVFDPEARMTSYGSAQTDGYTGDGLRAWKSTGGTTTYFLYDADDQPVCEFNSSGSVTATDTFGTDGLISRHTSTSAFYVFDPSGNVSERLTSTGTIASTDLTDGFGLRTTTDTTHDPFAFSGQWGGYNDAETGLVLLTHRYYDPSTGRWLTKDPIRFAGSINLYSYCWNNPISIHDPEGFRGLKDFCRKCLSTKKIIIGAGIAIITAVGTCIHLTHTFDCAKCSYLMDYAKECRDDIYKYDPVDGPYLDPNGHNTYARAMLNCVRQKAEADHRPNVSQCLKNCAQLVYEFLTMPAGG